MKTFRTTCAKNNQKIELIVKYNSLEEARESLHKQWYSILEIIEITDSWVLESGVFYFDAIINGSRKSGQVKSNDIFRAYRLLVEDLKYDVVFIYDDKNAEEKEKQLITLRVKESYFIYKSEKKPEKETRTEIKNDQEARQAEKINIISPILKKELEKYYWLIDRVIGKIENILVIYREKIGGELREKLEKIIISLRQVKNITNIDKLKLVWEMSLLKIGEVESSFVEQGITDEKKKFLEETNKLLKDFWSQKQIKTSEDGLIKIKDFFKTFIDNFFPQSKNKTEKDQESQPSYSYYKNLRSLHVYKQKLRQVNYQLFKYIISFDENKKTRLRVKKKLIIQNITLLENRIKNKKFSYTKIIKGYEYSRQFFLFLIKGSGDIIITAIFLYSTLFLFIQFKTHIFNQIINFNTTSIYVIVLLAFFAFLSKITKNLITMSIMGVLYIIFFAFIQINLS